MADTKRQANLSALARLRSDDPNYSVAIRAARDSADSNDAKLFAGAAPNAPATARFPTPAAPPLR